ncbi:MULTISPECIES: FxsA family protein [Halococcus]|uniref:Phage T7 F exclusion suppressor FxsA n=1 Tax=Halococcus salifodinae DSM 8989 TaxID=1227456 RepID=M0N1X3_9EURY|nr:MULTISPECIES: FxsA family protein [Halococcus]EMA50705.1 phage T7 F exclusion suppressor FxsA [Halococcus salifodinae DSM 8989]
MVLRIIGLLLLIPLFDAVLLVAVAGWIGAIQTVALVVLTALIGMLLVRAEGRHTARKIQQRVEHGQLPGDELLDGGLLIAAGAFLLTPGLVTDAVGLLLTVPVTRWPIRSAIKRWLVVPYIDRKTGGMASGGVYVGGFPGGTDTDDSDIYDVDGGRDDPEPGHE